MYFIIGKEYYNMLYSKPTQVVWMPHLTIYIDASVSQCKELIAKRNNVRTNCIINTNKFSLWLFKPYNTPLLRGEGFTLYCITHVCLYIHHTVK